MCFCDTLYNECKYNCLQKTSSNDSVKIFLCFFAHGGMQLELVALLFSDVLLLTKIQKKGERLKVFRPPLALDRTTCIPLKDGCELNSLADMMEDFLATA